jgi:uncharacterized protein (TIGR02271 family)
MATKDFQQNVHTSGQRIIAFFSDKHDAYRAISQLKDAGFSSNEIGLVSREDQGAAGTSRGTETSRNIDTSRNTTLGTDTGNDESFWDKVKHFFSGDSADNEYVDYRDTSESMKWDQNRADYYYRGIGQGGALVSVTGPRLEEARTILQNAGGDLRETGFSADATSRTRATQAGQDQEYRMQLRGEVLRTYRDRVQRGEVRLRKEVITENQTVDVPVTREELVIERVAGSGQTAAGAGEIGKDEEIRVPLTEERARVEKQPVVNEEVRVGKRAVQSTEKVSGEVRHEELRVDNDENVKVENRTTSKSKKPAA